MARPSRPARDAYRHFRELGTRWFDNDVFGHLNNTLHYQFFDTAVNLHMIEAGVLDPVASDTVFFVVESGCRYHAPLAFPETVTAGIRVSHLGRASVRYEIGLFAEGGEAAAADGFFVHVAVDRATQKSVALPPDIRAVLEPLQ